MGEDDTGFVHFVFEVPMDHRSRDVQQEDLHCEDRKSNLGSKKIFGSPQGEVSHEWEPQRECVK